MPNSLNKLLGQGVMVIISMKLMPPKVIGKKFVYKLEVILGYQKNLDLKNA
jgi:hypothetical protein